MTPDGRVDLSQEQVDEIRGQLVGKVGRVANQTEKGYIYMHQ